MDRVVVLGIPGSGKSTISRFLGDHFGIPVLHLDTIFWLPNWQKGIPREFSSNPFGMDEASAMGR
jgi:adenylate kinase family enzyme